MREVYISDLMAAARVLLSVPLGKRDNLCAQLLKEADCADKFVKRLGKHHKKWGNGTLMAAARKRKLLPERAFSDTDYILCLMIVLDGLQRHRAAKACKSRLHDHMKIKLHRGFAFG